MAAKTGFNQQAIREEITNRIVGSLKDGKVPWRKMWSSEKNCGTSCNIVSKKIYRGINPFLLEISRMDFAYRCQWWGTYKQFKELGGQVRKGEHGTRIVFWKILEKDTPGEDKKKKIFFLRYYTVFNLEQVDGGEKLDKFRPEEEPDSVNFGSDDAFKTFDEVIAATKADIRFGGDKAYYKRPTGPAWPKHTGGDFIGCPNRRQFPDCRDWYDTLLHELAHWSEVRLKWEGPYAMGELVAEISACFIPPALGLPISENMENHQRYLKSWLEKMKDDPKFIFRAASQAQKVSDFILHFSNPDIEWVDEEEKDG